MTTRVRRVLLLAATTLGLVAATAGPASAGPTMANHLTRARRTAGPRRSAPASGIRTTTKSPCRCTTWLPSPRRADKDQLAADHDSGALQIERRLLGDTHPATRCLATAAGRAQAQRSAP